MSKWPTLKGRLNQPFATRGEAIAQMKANGDTLTPLAEKILREETRGLVKKWENVQLSDPKDMPVLIESHSTLIMEDGTRIDYTTEEEKQEKLRNYYGKH